MAQPKDFVIKTNRIRSYHAPVGTAFPSHDKLDPASMKANTDWESLGYTSKETPVTITSEGGEITALDTSEEDSLLAIASNQKFVLTLVALNFDVETMSLAYNGSYDEDALEYSVPTSSQPLTRRLLIVIENHVGRHIALGALCAISAGEQPTLSFESFSSIGLKANVLGEDGVAMRWIGIKRSTSAPLPVE